MNQISVAINGREFKFTPQDLAKHVEREITYRERVYPKMIMNGRMQRDKAELEIAAMRAVKILLEREFQPELLG